MSNQEILASLFPERYKTYKESFVYTLVCDASYSEIKNRAGLGVFDYARQSPLYDVVDAKDSADAEFKAIKMAISYAIEMGYRKVKIIHDCQGKHELAKKLADEHVEHFESIKIEWRSRECVRVADAIAKSALKHKRRRS